MSRNTVGKGEIARYEQFLLSPQSLQKACFPGASKGVIVSEWVNERNTSLLFDCQTLPLLDNEEFPIFECKFSQP